MRLSEKELGQIRTVFSQFMQHAKGYLYLYGSRVDDRKKGGDIDFLLLLENEKSEAIKKKKIDILVDLKEQIGDQKIDLVICTKDEIQKDPFLKGIYPEAVLLNKWE